MPQRPATPKVISITEPGGSKGTSPIGKVNPKPPRPTPPPPPATKPAAPPPPKEGN